MTELTIKTMYDLDFEYTEFVNAEHPVSLDLSKWLPSLGIGRDAVRPLVPGELAFILGDTGTGKTSCLQNIAMYANPLPTLMCELELPGTLCFERFAAMALGAQCRDVERQYKMRPAYVRLEAEEYVKDIISKLGHVAVCDHSRLDEYALESLIMKHYPEKLGHQPAVVIVDYIGLMESKGAKRYERVSRAAEELKRTAKNTNTIMICASQIHRGQDDDEGGEVFLHSAKDSGSIENSAGLLLGLWRDDDDKRKLYVKVLKNTKGEGGKVVTCNFDGARMTITEMARGVE